MWISFEWVNISAGYTFTICSELTGGTKGCLTFELSYGLCGLCLLLLSICLFRAQVKVFVSNEMNE